MIDLLPIGWANATIKDLAGPDGIVTDGDWVESKDQDPEGTVRLIQLADVGDGVFLNRSSRFMKLDTANRLRCTFLSPGDVLVARMPDPLGRACIFPGLPGPAVTAVDVLVWRSGRSGADPKWLMHALNSPQIRDSLGMLAGGTTRQRVSGGNVKRLEIPAPPILEQRRIVDRIEALFARTRRARADLERIAPLSSKYVEAETDRAYDYGTKAGWHVAAAGDLCDIKSGVTLGKRYAPDAELVERPYLRVANVQRGHLRLDEIKTVRLSATEADRLTLRPGDVLMNEGGDRDKLGRGWVWSGEVPCCVHQNHVFRLRLRDSRITPRYLSRYANHAGARYFLGEGKQTTNLASISMSKVAALPVPVPPQGEAARIDRTLDAVSQSAAICEQEAIRALTLLDRLERSILARAFRGELVPQEPSDSNEAPPATSSTARRQTARQPAVTEPT